MEWDWILYLLIAIIVGSGSYLGPKRKQSIKK